MCGRLSRPLAPTNLGHALPDVGHEDVRSTIGPPLYNVAPAQRVPPSSRPREEAWRGRPGVVADSAVSRDRSNRDATFNDQSEDLDRRPAFRASLEVWLYGSAEEAHHTLP